MAEQRISFDQLANLLSTMPDESVLKLLEAFKKRNNYLYCGLGFGTNHTTHMLQNGDFLASYIRMQERKLEIPANGQRIFDRGADAYHKYIAVWAARYAIDHGYNLAEFGVYAGATSYVVSDYYSSARQETSKFWLVDTYCGIPPASVHPEEEQELSKNGRLYPVNSSADLVRDTFSTFPWVEVVEGAVPEVLSTVNWDNLGYVHIDMNTVSAEIAAIEHIWEAIVRGGRILLDDYGWARHVLQRDAFDTFCDQRGLSVLALPTGQGLIIK